MDVNGAKTLAVAPDRYDRAGVDAGIDDATEAINLSHRPTLVPTLQLRLLSETQRSDLRRWTNGQRVEHRLRFRARIIWDLFVERFPPADVARTLETSAKTVCKWRDRYLSGGLKALHDRPRSGAPSKFTVAQRCEVIAIACDDPANYGYPSGTRWTLDSLTEVAGTRVEGPEMSRSSVQRTLTAPDLHPHKIRMWLHSPDPKFKEKVNEVVGLYLEPPEGAVVLSVDEKTGVQALERRFPTTRPRPGQPGRYEFEYTRHGTTSLTAAFNIQTGEVVGRLGPTRKAVDFMAFLDQVAEHYHEAEKIIVIMDNLNTHKEGPEMRLTALNARHGNRFEFHYTPLHASWVNQVEIYFGILHKAVLRWGNFASVAELEATIRQFIERWNTIAGHPFNWTFRGYPLQSKAA